MANLLDQFKVKVQANQSTTVDFISTISPSGDFTSITDFDVLVHSWSNILKTPKRTYIDDPEYGSNLYKYVFQPADEMTQNSIMNEVYTVLTIYDDRALIEKIEVEFFNGRKGFNVNIYVNYNNSSQSFTLTII